MNLSLQDEISILHIEILRHFHRLIGRSGDIATLNENVVLPHEILALVLVEIEKSLHIEGETLVESPGQES